MPTLKVRDDGDVPQARPARRGLMRERVISQAPEDGFCKPGTAASTPAIADQTILSQIVR